MSAIARRWILATLWSLLLFNSGHVFADEASAVDRIRESGQITVGVRRDAQGMRRATPSRSVPR